MDTDIENTRDVRKTAVINNELVRLKVDIAALQETRLAGHGSIREKDFTFFWHGKSVDERREHGVGFAVKNTLLRSVEVGSDGNERIATLRLHTKKGTATLVSVYAHTLYADDDVKDAFYERLNLIVGNLPKHDQLVILGDFNARVGADHDSWAPCLGHFGFGKMNSNG
ncbi:MAG: endonuclease/exonuclease/phosphatase family protein, partial [Bacteroidota bacterium]